MLFALQFLSWEPSATHHVSLPCISTSHALCTCFFLNYVSCLVLESTEVSDSGVGSQRDRKHKNFHFRERPNFSSVETETNES